MRERTLGWRAIKQHHLVVRIGGRYIALVRPYVRRYEAALVLRCSEREVLNMLRRGQRLQSRGLGDEEIVARAALPVEWVGASRRVRVEPLIDRLSRSTGEAPRGDLLALEVLAAILEGRLAAPRARNQSDPAPGLLEVVPRL